MVYDEHRLDYLDIQNSSYAFRCGNHFTSIKDLKDMTSITYGIFINDPFDQDKVNCVLKIFDDHSAIFITKDIKRGDELFMEYGKEWWVSFLKKYKVSVDLESKAREFYDILDNEII
jgi:hypothetical protein